MLKKMLKMLRNEQGIALISVILLFVVLSIVGISLTGVATYSHRKSISNWQYEQAHYIARSSAVSIRDYAKSIINNISELDSDIAEIEYAIAEAEEEGDDVDLLVEQRELLIEQCNAEKAKIESILSSGTNMVKATGKILSATDDDFEATIEELEAGEEEYSSRKYRVRSKGTFQGIDAVATVYINYKPVDDYLPYLGPTPDPGYSVGGLMDSFVFYSSVKNIMASTVQGDVNVLGDASMVSAVDNQIYGNMYVGSLGNGQNNSVFAQLIDGDLISPTSLTVYASNVSGAVIVDGDLKLGLNNGDASHPISQYVSARGNVTLENGVIVPIVYTKGNLYLGGSSSGAFISGITEADGSVTAAKVEGGIEITNSGTSGNLMCNEDVVFTRGEVNGNISTCGKVTINTQSIVARNVIANKGVKSVQGTVGGDIYSESEINLQDTIVGGSVYSESDITLRGCSIGGNVMTEGSIVFPSEYWSGTYNDLIAYGDIIIQHGGCTINNIIAMGDIYIDGNATVNGYIISIGGTITDNRWGDKSANYPDLDSISITMPEIPMLKAERITVDLPRNEDTRLTLTKFDTFTIPGSVKSADAGVYKEDVKTIVINSSGKINTGWFDSAYGSSTSLLGRTGPNAWDGYYDDQTLIIDATDDDVDLYLDDDLKFQHHIIKRILIRGRNVVRLFMEKGSSFIMDGVTIASETNQYAVSNDGLVPPNFYIMASSATLTSDIPQISFGSTNGTNTFEGYIISPSSDITVINTRVLGAIVSNNLTELRGSDMSFYPANKLEEAMAGLNYTFRSITVDSTGIHEQAIMNP